MQVEEALALCLLGAFLEQDAQGFDESRLARVGFAVESHGEGLVLSGFLQLEDGLGQGLLDLLELVLGIRLGRGEAGVVSASAQGAEQRADMFDELEVETFGEVFGGSHGVFLSDVGCAWCGGCLSAV